MNSRHLMAKSLIVATVLSLVIILSLPAAADTLVVPDQFSSIQAAIDAADPGDTDGYGKESTRKTSPWTRT